MTVGAPNEDGWIIRDARPGDLTQLTSLLQEASLPTIGVREHLHTFLVLEEKERIVGSIGLEVYGDTALLRSAVVAGERRNSGLGSTLYETLLERARALGVRRLVLLTNTAEEYFRRKGFRKVDQKSISGPVTTSVEFTGACPSHTACMVYDLPKRVLVVCTGNSCRSQMAEGFLKSFGPGLEVFSAGTHPAGKVHRRAIAVMKEINIDISAQYPKSIDEFIALEFDTVLTVCDHANKNCPTFTGQVKNRLHIGIDDPTMVLGSEAQVMAEFRRVRDEIGRTMKELYERERDDRRQRRDTREITDV